MISSALQNAIGAAPLPWVFPPQGPRQVEICPVRTTAASARSQMADSSHVASHLHAWRPIRTLATLPGPWEYLGTQRRAPLAQRYWEAMNLPEGLDDGSAVQRANLGPRAPLNEARVSTQDVGPALSWIG